MAAIVLGVAARFGWTALKRRRRAHSYRAVAALEAPDPPSASWNPPWRPAEPPAISPPSESKSWRGVALLLGLLVVAIGTVLAAGAYVDRSRRIEDARRLTGGEPERAPQLVARYGCGGCHTIPGLSTARGKVGPNLQGVGARVYIAGRVTNTPEHMISFIANPPALAPGTAMPVTGISEAEAADIAAYFYAVR